MRADPVADFVNCATRYVEVVEAAEGEIAIDVAIALAAFYAAAIALPDADPRDEDATFDIDVTQRMAAEARLRASLGSLDAVLVVGRSPSTDAVEAYQMSLAYALAKVYAAALDVLAGPEAVWEWRWDVWSNWGDYATKALLALSILFESAGPLPTPL